jgi:hypothetical protein
MTDSSIGTMHCQKVASLLHTILLARTVLVSSFPVFFTLFSHLQLAVSSLETFSYVGSAADENTVINRWFEIEAS